MATVILTNARCHFTGTSIIGPLTARLATYSLTFQHWEGVGPQRWSSVEEISSNTTMKTYHILEG